MITTKVTDGNVEDFIAYCREYAAEHDESNIPEKDYLPRADEPAFLLLDNTNKIIGAAALMLHSEYIEAKKARFRIFHCAARSYDNYNALLNEILKNSCSIGFIYCFIPEDKHDVRKIWEALGFAIWRYSWVFERDSGNIERFEFPEGYSVRTLAEGRDELSWCDIINEAFADMHGHTRLKPEKIGEWRKQPCYIDGGMKLLYHFDKPVGTIALVKETDNGENVIFIESIGILKSYQGIGLGRNLLRYGVNFARAYGVKKVMLSVNAENKSASELYLKEGFKKREVYVCYGKNLE